MTADPAGRAVRVARMRARAEEFFDRHPADRDAWSEAVGLIRAAEAAGAPIPLPGGGPLTVGRAQGLGMLLGGNTRVDRLHWVLAEAVDRTGPAPRLSETFLAAVADQDDRLVNPLYTVLHEAIYAQPADLAGGRADTGWSASRMLAEHPDFDPEATTVPLPTGEHVMPWSVEVDPRLRPLAGTARLLAERTQWGPLYDVASLAQNTVPVAAAVYADDVYVDRDLSLETARRVRGLQVWETDAFHHDGIADDGPAILDRLLAMTAPDGAGTTTAPDREVVGGRQIGLFLRFRGCRCREVKGSWKLSIAPLAWGGLQIPFTTLHPRPGRQPRTGPIRCASCRASSSWPGTRVGPAPCRTPSRGRRAGPGSARRQGSFALSVRLARRYPGHGARGHPGR